MWEIRPSPAMAGAYAAGGPVARAPVDQRIQVERLRKRSPLSPCFLASLLSALRSFCEIRAAAEILPHVRASS